MLRNLAFEVLDAVENKDSYANLVLTRILRDAKIDSRDAGFVQELSFGAIRQKLFHERIIELASVRKASEIEPAALIVLRLGCYQLLEMRVPAHAAINESVNLAKRVCSKGAVGFINAVLRKVSAKSASQWLDLATSNANSKEAQLSLRYSHPVWIIKALQQALDSRGLASSLEHSLEANNLPAKVSIVCLPGLSSPSDFSADGSAGPASPLGVEISGNPTSIAAIGQGRARVQDQGSQLAVLCLTEAPLEIKDSNWLDLCAGPGGKAAFLGALAAQAGIALTANEILSHRVELVRQAILLLPDVQLVQGDGRLIASRGDSYSRILLDAPCTGLGALRRRPEARWRKGSADIADLSKLQRELFDAAWSVLLPGGILGYVVCSPHLSETTAQVSWALAKYKKEIELLNSNRILNGLNANLRLDEKFLTTQLWPHINGTDAMFIALFRKSVS
jgi:16S rRNA (cytosine967-C5)-methyltransferase